MESQKVKTVIDLSKWNVIKDYSKLVSSCDGVILRIGYRSTKTGGIITDQKFLTHLKALKPLHCPLGVYFFTEAINVTEAREEARWVVSMVKKHNISLSFPIGVDSEFVNTEQTGRSDKLSKAVRTNCVLAFADEIRKLGYNSMLYSSDTWFVDQLDYTRVKSYPKWVARYSTKRPECAVDHVVGWQKTDKFNVVGTQGVDMSEWYLPISEMSSKWGQTQQIETIKPSTLLILDNVPLFSSSKSTKACRMISGEYYKWSEDICYGRVRITAKEEYIGVTGKVTGWINI